MKFYYGFVQISNGRIRVYSKYLVDETRVWRSKFRPGTLMVFLLLLTTATAGETHQVMGIFIDCNTSKTNKNVLF